MSRLAWHRIARSAARPTPGFTLVEVLVAMTVMALMAAMAWQGVDGIVRARGASQARLDQTLRLNTVMAQWDQDLASIEKSGDALPQALSCDGATVRLSRRTPTGMQVVAWSLQPDPAASIPGTSVWKRWASPPVTTVAELTDNWLRSQQMQGNLPGTLYALDGLTQWQVYFYQGNAWGNCQSSLGGPEGPTPPPSSPTGAQLPSGVRLVLSFAPGSGREGNLVRDTALIP